MTQRRTLSQGRSLLAAALCAVFGVSAAAQDSGRVASIDYCADQYVLALTERERIAALSYEATSAHSFFRDRAAGLPVTRGMSDEVLALGPNLLVRSWRGSAATDALFEKAGIITYPLPYAHDADSAFETLRSFGATIGRTREAERFVAARQRLRARLKQARGSTLKALYLTPSGFTAGTGTSVDSVIKAAGFDTVSADYGLAGWQPLPLEAILTSPPDLIVTSFFDLSAKVSHWSRVRHPAVRDLLNAAPVIDLPSGYLTCNNLFSVDAAALIRDKGAALGLIEAAPVMTAGAAQ